MKALLFHTHGGVEVLEYTDIATPSPGPGEVLVKLTASALNRLDIWARHGWPGMKIEYPHILGADGAGHVAALGPGVNQWSIDQRVVINPSISCGNCEFCIAGQDNLCRSWSLLGESRRGTNAEYVVVPATNIYPVPTDFDLHAAAAAALVFQTAWHSLISRGGLRPGESVLIIGASGGVNTASIQIARLAGAVVYVVGSGQEKLALAQSLGANFLIDRSVDDNWARTIYQMTDKRGVDVVVDNVGTTFPSSFRAARKGGRILTVGNTGGPKFEIDNRFIFGKHLSLIGSSMSDRHDFATVMDLIFAGKLKAVLDRTYPLEDGRLAYERLEKGEQSGKITLSIR
jgi:NADPH:quinone reductase-like Zn-dependent oxidoreductase